MFLPLPFDFGVRGPRPDPHNPPGLAWFPLDPAWTPHRPPPSLGWNPPAWLGLNLPTSPVSWLISHSSWTPPSLVWSEPPPPNRPPGLAWISQTTPSLAWDPCPHRPPQPGLDPHKHLSLQLPDLPPPPPNPLAWPEPNPTHSCDPHPQAQSGHTSHPGLSMQPPGHSQDPSPSPFFEPVTARS